MRCPAIHGWQATCGTKAAHTEQREVRLLVPGAALQPPISATLLVLAVVEGQPRHLFFGVALPNHLHA